LTTPLQSLDVAIAFSTEFKWCLCMGISGAIFSAVGNTGAAKLFDLDALSLAEFGRCATKSADS